MSDFKSSVPWGAPAATLPTYHGGAPGKAAVRKAEMEAGGMGEIRRVEWSDLSGRTYVLNTRNGMPEVVANYTRRATAPVSAVKRGWLACLPAANVATLFSPYTLDVRSPEFTPPETSYTVLPFSTPFNVDSSDATGWHDVVSFSVNGLLVNGAPIPVLSATGAMPSDGALPWIISDETEGAGVALYGVAEENTAYRRLFAIHRHFVHSWGGVDLPLAGASHRNDGRALVCGPRILADSNQAMLMQLEYVGYTWDDIDSRWGITWSKMAMYIVPPFLGSFDNATVVDLPLSPLTLLGLFSDVTVSERSLPPTEVALIGVGEAHPTAYPGMSANVGWPWADVFTAKMEGTTSISRTGDNYSGGYVDSIALGANRCTVSISNAKTFLHNSETVGWKQQGVDLPPYGGTTGNPGELMGEMREGGAFYWPYPAAPGGPLGSSVLYTYSGNIPQRGSFDTEDQGGEMYIDLVGGGYTSVSTAPVRLVDIRFKRSKVAGVTVTPHGTDGRFQGYLDNPTGQFGETGGFGQFSTMHIGGDYSAGWLAFEYGRLDEALSMVADKANQVASVKVYDCQMLDMSAGGYYTGTLNATSSDERTLTWATKDFILFDETNQAFISVEAEFSGSQHGSDVGVARLAVALKVSTPGGGGTQPLFSTTIAYGELLEEYPLGDGGRKYIPSPRLRTMFAPMHQEQGGFRGAAYTTEKEVSAGAVPAYLFNFMLGLGTYYDIGVDLGDSTQVRFIPCNLLEMLYAYVFSSKYGVDDYQRYPVDFTNRYNMIMATLFSTQWRVNYRDGVFVDWLDTLGGAYATEETTGLYRI